MTPSPLNLPLMRLSLIAVWLGTALVSLLERHAQSLQLLTRAGLDPGPFADTLIWGGAMVDLALGLAIWLRPSRKVYLAALGVMLGMTTLATLMLPDLWLHPLGPLLKNLPIAVMLWVLAEASQ